MLCAICAKMWAEIVKLKVYVTPLRQFLQHIVLYLKFTKWTNISKFPLKIHTKYSLKFIAIVMYVFFSFLISANSQHCHQRQVFGVSEHDLISLR